MRSWCIALVLAVSCSSPPERPAIIVVADSDSIALVRDSLQLVPYEPLEIRESSDPAGDVAAGGVGIHIAVVSDLDCTECYELEQFGNTLVVHGDAPLGVQYGLTESLEALGFRFFNPWRPHVPGVPSVDPDRPVFGVRFSPEVATRGLHLHTLHTIEGYYAFWEPGEQNLADAERIVDWAIKQRANYIQWVALDNIASSSSQADAWREHTQRILDVIHRRGMKAGIGLQLFGESNLQNGFDLLDDGTTDARAAMEQRYAVLMNDLDFDSISLSFGEFFGVDPQQFIDQTNLAYEVMQQQAPGTRMTATIHVGDSPDQRVTFMNEDLIYYFLVKFADEAIVPWIHTVMYYDLFEPAGGAYHHEDFSEHREFLLDKLRAGEPVGYHPETAYWIAFDISVPNYLPLYMRSRWLDLSRIREDAGAGASPLPEQTLFSSGWEWGYWQNDYAALRMSYQLPETWDVIVRDMYSVYGDAGDAAAELIAQLGELQGRTLIDQKLAAYMAGRDTYIDLGDEIDVVSQPDRPSFEEILELTPVGLDVFETDVLGPLDVLAAETRRMSTELELVGLPDSDPYARELLDGFAVSAARAEYVLALYRAVVAEARGEDTSRFVDRATDSLAEATAIVSDRHANLAYPNSDSLLFGTTNFTLYQWGYLKQTHEMCYWKRELVELERAIDGSSDSVPSCIF